MGNKKPEAGKGNVKWRGLSANLLYNNLTYVFFVALLIIVYIFNTHNAENALRETKKLESKIREAKWEYMSLKSEVMQKSTRSEIGRKLEGYKDLDDQELPQKIDLSKS